MSILWFGGEDIDFSTRITGMYSNITTAGRFLANYARLAIQVSNTSTAIALLGNIFPGGAITSGWYSQRVYGYASAGGFNGGPASGLAKNGTGGGGIYWGPGSANTGKSIAIWSVSSAGIKTKLVEEVAQSFALNALHKIDMQIIGWNTSNGTVNLYVDNSLVLTYSGSLVVSGVPYLDQIGLYGVTYTQSISAYISNSAFIVADEDTRPMEVVAHFPNGTGDNSGWTNGYASIDEITLDDTDCAYTTSAAELNCALSDLPSGNFVVKAVKISSRVTDGVGGLNYAQGFRSNGVTSTDTPRALDGYWGTEETIFQQNPQTSNRFTPDEVNNMQLALVTETA